MAIRQVTVPWTRGYDVGVGADLATGSPMGLVVVGEASPVDDAAGASVDIRIQRVLETAELERALGIDVEASYGSAAFGAGVSARFSFAKESKVQSSCLFMTVSVHVELEFLSIDDPALSEHAGEVIDNPELFATRYGNMFVRGMGRGGLFVGVLRVETGSSEESTNIATELEGSYGVFSTDAEVKFKDIQRKYRNEVFVQMYHEGGPVDLKITDPREPLQLLDNANKFLDSFKATPERVARPYFVTLAPLSIARGPQPPNAAEIEHAQDVLVYCAKRRSALLDQLNLVDYIRDNPSQFEEGTGAGGDALTSAAQDFQADLDLIADCASNAIDDPVNAKLPTDFAADQGKTFPKGVLPSPLPTPKGASGATVIVPDFGGCATWTACRELAQLTGLALDYEYQGEYDLKNPVPFRVIDFRPPKGTPVAPGTVVTIVCPPDLPNFGLADITRPLWLSRLGG